MIPPMWTERRDGHLFVWWRGQLIYKAGPSPRELVFDPFGPPWQLPREAPFRDDGGECPVIGEGPGARGILYAKPPVRRLTEDERASALALREGFWEPAHHS